VELSLGDDKQENTGLQTMIKSSALIPGRGLR